MVQKTNDDGHIKARSVKRFLTKVTQFYNPQAAAPSASPADTNENNFLP